jgi:hypothetical protein
MYFESFNLKRERLNHLKSSRSLRIPKIESISNISEAVFCPIADGDTVTLPETFVITF